MRRKSQKWIERATRKTARRCERNRFDRPREHFAYQAWDDHWRSLIMDQLVKVSDGDERAFAAGAVILLVGWQIGYDG
jgi:hypothetical protein